MVRPDPRRNLTRVRQPGGRAIDGRGWLVRLKRRGTSFRQYFADSEYGGKRAALAAAKIFRDQIEQQYPKHTVASLAAVRTTGSRSPLVGVRLETRRRGGGSQHHVGRYWIAQWIDGHGRRRTRCFSVDQYGAREAKRLAIAARQEGIRRANR